MKAQGPKLYKKLKNSGVIAQADFHLVPKEPEIGFNPEHNRQVVERTIELTKKREAELARQYREKVEERVDAATDYLRALASRPMLTAENYFGRRELAHLRGEAIREELMQKMRLLSES